MQTHSDDDGRRREWPEDGQGDRAEEKARELLAGLRHYPEHLAGREPSDTKWLAAALREAEERGETRVQEDFEICLERMAQATGLEQWSTFYDIEERAHQIAAQARRDAFRDTVTEFERHIATRREGPTRNAWIDVVKRLRAKAEE